MKKICFLYIACLCVVATGCADKVDTIRLAFISGMNPEFNYELYAPVLTSKDISWKAYTNEESQELFRPENDGAYDVIVFYDICLEDFPEASRQDLVRVMRAGKPALVLHDGLLTYNTWPEFASIAGMKYFMSAQEVDGKPYGVSFYMHEQDIPIEVADKDHFITQGMDEAFVVHDEIYDRLWKAADIHPLWTTTHPDSERVVMYTHTYGQAKVVGIVVGHGPEIFRDNNFKLAFERSARWLAQ
jgi:hypothetical protein